ncbi:hypothetical protein HMPREF0653_02300 [Prevotella disiens JCM 6334 = ATCC 29426]|uniref:Uncharacterized protein n=1 Tax=Prevotella disiens JCM 6334 = ATCC 29426 TaxID=1235811 RepID=A0ABN0NPK2_9BACT|nr:hypothetical protein HMPREF0653_02300 [Prevotella disiens JCM 6334 = ATCC 29426]
MFCAKNIIVYTLLSLLSTDLTHLNNIDKQVQNYEKRFRFVLPIGYFLVNLPY